MYYFKENKFMRFRFQHDREKERNGFHVSHKMFSKMNLSRNGGKGHMGPVESYGWNSFCHTASSQLKYYIQSFVFAESFVQNIDRAYLFNRRTSKIFPLGLLSEIIKV